ncbi:MAG: hypothetical protein ACREKI_06535, partial [Gemmatimonadota bacterium]
LARDRGPARARSTLEVLAWARLVAARLVEAQPAMAPFYHLANVLLGAAACESATEAVARVRAAPLAFAEEAEAYAAAAAERAATLVPEGGTVVTYSRSHSVLEALRVGADSGRLWTVRVSEARPKHEGRSVARDAAEWGHRVEFFTDAGLLAAVGGADVLLVGADAIGESRLRNKAGTAALARSARAAGVPAYVVTDPLKLLPERLWIPEEERPAREVWAVRRRRVTVRNRYFEDVPLSLFDGIVLGARDRDAHPPGDLTRWPAADYFQPLERLLAGG